MTDSFAEKLSTVDIKPEESYAQIVIEKPEICKRCSAKACCSICPTGVFRLEDNRIKADHRLCIECGACVLACPDQNIELNYPCCGLGVRFHQG